jgi:8-oxo-dGTP pyrophosphatase MutT (NUDIX family)
MSHEEVAVKEGAWGGDIKWELYVSQKLPPTELITAVFCVAIDSNDEIVLARSERGWGLLGGHIEDGEELDVALVREAQEEGGFNPDNPQMFAYRKITASKPKPHQNPDKQYSFPTSYLTYYWATTASPISQFTGTEIIESTSFTLDEVKSLNTPDLPIIELGYKSFVNYSK